MEVRAGLGVVRGSLRSAPMRPRTAVFLLLGPLMLLVALVAFGQPTQSGDPSSDASDAGVGSRAAGDAGAAVPDVGPPPPTARRGDGGPRPSPLTPRPDEFPDGGAGPPPAELDAILGDIASLRARVAALTSTLFASKLRILVETEDAEFARIQSLVVTLDDGVVFRADEGFVAEDERVVFEHAVAPGHHVIGVEIERADARDRAYKTMQQTKLSVVVPEGRELEAHVYTEEDSDMAEDFPEDRDGEYDLRVRMRARVIPD